MLISSELAVSLTARWSALFDQGELTASRFPGQVCSS